MNCVGEIGHKLSSLPAVSYSSPLDDGEGVGVWARG